MNLENLVTNLIKIESISPKDKGCFNIIEPILNELGFVSERIDYKNVENLYSVYGNDGPTFCFLGHTDVVPTGPENLWTHPPFSAKKVDDKIYGRGAADMKGNICAFLKALSEFINSEENLNFKIAILLTSNEEGESDDGFIDILLDKLIQRGEKIDYCLVGEPSSSEIVGDTIRIGRRGSLSGKLKILGKQGHIAYPEKIINPIFLVSNIITELKEKKWDVGNDHFQPTSFQISNINSGTGAGNIVPGELMMDFNFRFCSESTSEGLIEEFEKILNSYDIDYKVEWNLSGLPYLTTKTYFVDLVIDSIKKVLGREPVINNGGGTSDGRFMAVMDAEIVELGPLNETIHKIDENVSIKDLKDLSKIYLEILKKIATSNS
ncbi:MAG: succinyl-diaminopimelate desuccinylase [Gammaproteobacteria bacterium]|jgi:succinyl-diaminopimelate desuccinylase|nr:succinyl-diaminopimelate desuccinylase [Gammaproteobacteria bacterium]|tara:strand:+ start:2520 stop:3656 length:1137 start_codon:yes stop_codon:yes gene_type:complete